MDKALLGEIEFIQARSDDANIASSIMQEAAAWLEGTGQTLWFPEELAPDRLKASIDAGELYLVMLDRLPVGTVIFQLTDTLYWPDMSEGDAAYIHKITLIRSVAGMGLGRKIIAWAREKA
ncbi:MAG TPA: hypothetical protein VMU10_03360, partial [Desulfomonilia bacterium]|nr:hypothetical protein [Desulfomonilia bacterium]